MITTVAAVKAALMQPLDDNTLTALCTPSLLLKADAMLKGYCKRDLEPPADPYVEYHSGRGRRLLCLRQKPILSTDDIVGVWVDQRGYAGQASNAFPASTLLTLGRDYILRPDGSVGSFSESAILERLISPFLFYGQPGTLYGGPVGATWQYGTGNIKVEYTAGYSPLPDDLVHAGGLLCALAIRTGPQAPGSAALTGENLGGYSYSLNYPGKDDPPEITTVREILGRYREKSVA